MSNVPGQCDAEPLSGEETPALLVHKLNQLSDHEARAALHRCNGSSNWTEQMMSARPFKNSEALFSLSDQIWFSLSKSDWMEGFNHHPRIGDFDKLKQKFSITSNWSAGEQAGVTGASGQVLLDLKQGNEEYERKFGYIFIVCASGKSAGEMLAILRGRFDNSPEEELKIALREHAKITRLRLEKLCQE
jgi:2-oxo-4-hydroxy-4-carboxy-5-ureidoimidazoline decarboxylase